MFPTEEHVIEYFEKLLWKNIPVCPHCGSQRSTPRPERKGHRCKDCRKYYSVKVSTIFEKSQIPLQKWLFAIYLIVTARKGISSLQLSKELDITQKSAWLLLHRIREVCNKDSGLLSGIIEIDETYIHIANLYDQLTIYYFNYEYLKLLQLLLFMMGVIFLLNQYIFFRW